MTWKVLVVDDEENIRNATKANAHLFSFMEQSLDILEASNSEEAIAFFIEHDDIAVIILDVVCSGQQDPDTFVREFS